MRGGGFEVFGIKNMMNRLDQSVLKLDALCKAAVSAGCALVEKEAKLSMRGAKSGKTYKVPGTKSAQHKASAPGEPPAILFGRLMASITWNIENREKAMPYTFKNGTDVATIPATGTMPLIVIGLIGTNLKYSKRLEYGFFGTDSMGRTYAQEPRPFLFPALKRKQGEIALLFRETLRKL